MAPRSNDESLGLALRIARYFGLPFAAVFALSPFPPLSTQVYAPAAGDESTEVRR